MNTEKKNKRYCYNAGIMLVYLKRFIYQFLAHERVVSKTLLQVSVDVCVCVCVCATVLKSCYAHAQIIQMRLRR